MVEDGPGDYAEIAALGAEIHALFERIARRNAGVTLVQLQALETLARVHPQPLEPHQVGRAIRVGSNHLAKVLDQLEAMGHLERRMHGTDRRRRLLSLTPAGLALVTAASPRIEAAEERLMAEAFTPEERELMREMTLRLRRALAEVVTPTRPVRPGP